MSNRQKRWMEFLNQFDIKISWTQEKNLPMADTLSRAAEHCINFFGININWEIEQNKDPTLKRVIESLDHGCKVQEEIPEWWKQCYIADDILKIREKNNGFEKINKFTEIIVVPVHLRNKLIWEAHREYPYGHYGIQATLNCLKQSYFWPKMKHDISETIKTCEQCQKTKPLNYKAGLIIPVQWNVTRPFQLVGMDFAGPLPRSKSGSEYFLLIIDYATSWIEAYATKKQNSTTVQQCLENWIHRYGLMENIITDGGTPFVSKESMSFYKERGVKKHTTSSYHPQSDGKAEANIKIIKNIIKRNILKNIIDENTWDEFLQTACFAVRTNTKTSTNRSPAELLFGFKLRTPINQNYQPDVEELYEIRKNIFEETQNQMKKYIRKYSKHYDINRKEIEFQIGDMVIVKKPHILKSLESKFSGPYKIACKMNNAYELADVNGRNPFNSTVNVERLKKFFAEYPHEMNEQSLEEEIDIYDEWPYDLSSQETDKEAHIQIPIQNLQEENKEERKLEENKEEPKILERGEGNKKSAKMKDDLWTRPREIKSRKQLVGIMQEKGISTKGTYTDLLATYESQYNLWHAATRNKRN